MIFDGDTRCVLARRRWARGRNPRQLPRPKLWHPWRHGHGAHFEFGRSFAGQPHGEAISLVGVRILRRQQQAVAIERRIFDDLGDLSVTHALDFARIAELKVMRAAQRPGKLLALQRQLHCQPRTLLKSANPGASVTGQRRFLDGLVWCRLPGWSLRPAGTTDRKHYHYDDRKTPHRYPPRVRYGLYSQLILRDGHERPVGIDVAAVLVKG